MTKAARIFIMLAIGCVVVAVVTKAVASGQLIPGMPLNWIRLADTCLLFSVALSLLGILKK